LGIGHWRAIERAAMARTSGPQSLKRRQDGRSLRQLQKGAVSHQCKDLRHIEMALSLWIPRAHLVQYPAPPHAPRKSLHATCTAQATGRDSHLAELLAAIGLSTLPRIAPPHSPITPPAATSPSHSPASSILRNGVSCVRVSWETDERLDAGGGKAGAIAAGQAAAPIPGTQEFPGSACTVAWIGDGVALAADSPRRIGWHAAWTIAHCVHSLNIFCCAMACEEPAQRFQYTDTGRIQPAWGTDQPFR
jgi:hypothetical protein